MGRRNSGRFRHAFLPFHRWSGPSARVQGTHEQSKIMPLPAFASNIDL
jgi:hypothetical protein